ncbi:MAG: dihydrolipoyl dehydrogenase [Prevotellaceae bacterium]|jgi:dihydrolipoamide dehydrogenase|nr:dihydrolipoyl dehydrogenase [Prevotellaceae bacterium]
MQYDLTVIGSGPGGYVAAIRASQLGMKTAIIECAEVGGVCLNRGCIPAKSLLKSMQALEIVKHSTDYGIFVENINADINKTVERAGNISASMRKGIDMLLKKNKIELIRGYGRLKTANTIDVSGEECREVTAQHIIIATGARPKELPALPVDEKYLLSYRKALFPETVPHSMVIVGSGAIGTELACFYNSAGTKVTLVEFMPDIVPSEDEEVSAQLSRSLRKAGIKVMTNSSVCSVAVNRDKDECTVEILTKKGRETVICSKVLSAVGVVANIENIGLENLGIEVENGKIKTDPFYRTNVKGVYAIGDVVNSPALAHVASSEAVTCVEKIAGLDVEPVDYTCIPSCIYTVPEVASVGMTERYAKAAGFSVKTGKFPYSASGKAATAGNRDGFVKLVIDEKTDKLLGAHLIGLGVTEIIAELTLALRLNATGKQIMKTMHPHPTMSEAVAEAAAAIYGEAVNL